MYLKNIKFKIVRILNIIQIKQISQNQKIYLIPNISKTNIYKKIIKRLNKENTKTEKVQIVLSKEVKKYEKNLKKFKVLDGKKVFLNSMDVIIEIILQGNSLAMQDIYILTNNYQEKNINLIRNMALKVKNMNVITKEITKYKIIEEMMQEWGIPIVVSNNKRKSLKKAKIIINLDFSKEELNGYIIYRNAVIINLTGEKLTNIKSFEGTIIQDLQLKLQENEQNLIEKNNLKNFRQIEIYESLQNNFAQTSKIKVSKLYGNNGQISEKELEKIKKNFNELNVKN